MMKTESKDSVRFPNTRLEPAPVIQELSNVCLGQIPLRILRLPSTLNIERSPTLSGPRGISRQRSGMRCSIGFGEALCRAMVCQVGDYGHGRNVEWVADLSFLKLASNPHTSAECRVGKAHLSDGVEIMNV
jgi:hypothetical protein